MDIYEFQSTISALKMIIGVLVVVIVILLIYIAILKYKLNVLRGDNGEMVKRLKIISRSKIID